MTPAPTDPLSGTSLFGEGPFLTSAGVRHRGGPRVADGAEEAPLAAREDWSPTVVLTS